MDWTNESILQFLRLYRSHRCIWDTKQQRNRDRVNAAWQDIQKNMSIPCTVHQLKKKKESLMSAYRAYKTKIKNSTAVVGGTEYKPSWFAFATMDSFLSTVYLCNATPWKNQSENDQNIEDTDVELDETNPLDENPEEEIPRKRKRQSFDTPQDDSSQISHENPKNSHEYPHCSHETSHIEEECELITKLWAKKLIRLPEDKRDDLIYKINSLLYKACIEYHKERTATVSAVKSRENISDYSESKSDDESIDFICIKTEPDDS